MKEKLIYLEIMHNSRFRRTPSFWFWRSL